jgi:hypothetical protein
MPTHILRGKLLKGLIRQSVGSPLFQYLPALQDGKRVNLVQDGDLSCALYESRLLQWAGLLGGHNPFATVNSLQRHLDTCEGWSCTEEDVSIVPEGSVIFWGPAVGVHSLALAITGGSVSSVRSNGRPDDSHRHVGFIVKDGAVSHSSYDRTPQFHLLPMLGREIEAVYVHPALYEE